jgi:hypothetical protein
VEQILGNLTPFQQYLFINGSDVTAPFGTRDMARVMGYFKDPQTLKEGKRRQKLKVKQQEQGLAVAGEGRGRKGGIVAGMELGLGLSV